jgi:membrane-bound lytic murein transglycosylase F
MEFESDGARFQPVILAEYSTASSLLSAMLRSALLVLLCATLAACGRPPSTLEQVQTRNELIVITRNGPTTYFEGPYGPAGFEYELAKRFAKFLGVELRMLVPPRFSDILPLTALGNAHLAAAGLTVTEKRKQQVRFGPVYQKITPQLVYRSGSTRPKTLADLDGLLEVVAGSSHEELLMTLKNDYPNLTWDADEGQDIEELLILVWQQLIEYTVADSNELAINRRFYPELKPAIDLSDPQPLAWAFPRSDDDSLFNAAITFFNKIKANGTLERLIDRYYGHIGEFDYVGTRRYQSHVELRLPEFRDMFVYAAKEVGVDWRLLAAISYQESHWKQDAVSPTGVRGLMMLTQAAAEDIGVDNRSDPAQSILGGAHYLIKMRQRISEEVPEPDRTWLALAAYNIGLGHLEDARILTQKNKGDPDKWVDVKKNLPLLSQKKWFQQTRYGYARGREPVRYVDNIRSYLDILIWLTEQDKAGTPAPPVLPQFDVPAL